MSDRLYDTIIIGSGPAGYTAGIYAKRAELNCILLEDPTQAGGQVISTYEVDNYPGLPGIDGFSLSQKFREHAVGLGLEIRSEKVTKLEVSGNVKKVYTGQNEYQSKTVILATGAVTAKLGVPGEEKLSGMGVSYCATCDGAFFRGKTTVVVGGGDVAVEDAIFLSRLCEKVYLVHRRDSLRATKALQTELFAKENVTVIWNSVVESINGTTMVESVSLKNVKTDEQTELPTNGIFIAVGIRPNTELAEEIKLTEDGYIEAGENCATSVPGVFAAGDVRKKQLRQIITAAGDGANAITSVERYIL